MIFLRISHTHAEYVKDGSAWTQKICLIKIFIGMRYSFLLNENIESDDFMQWTHFRIVSSVAGVSSLWWTNNLLQKVLLSSVLFVMIPNLLLDVMHVEKHLSQAWRRWSIRPDNGTINVSNVEFVSSRWRSKTDILPSGFLKI